MWTVRDPVIRRNHLFWLFAAYLVAAASMAFFRVGTPHFTFNFSMLLLYLATTAAGDRGPVWSRPITLFQPPGQTATDELRSQYEEQIRAVAVQEERNRVARDLHDSVKQQLFVIQTAAATAQARGSSDPAGASAALEQVRQAGRDAMAEMEAMLDNLKTPPLENTSLVEALRRQCEALEHCSGARVTLNAGNLPANSVVPPGAHEAVFRATQELLANVARHARASNVQVTLEEFGRELVLSVTDDGAGFHPDQASSGMGLSNLQTRALERGGRFLLESAPGRGTTARFTVALLEYHYPAQYLTNALVFAGLIVLLLVHAWRRQTWDNAALMLGALAFFLRFAAAYAKLKRETAK